MTNQATPSPSPQIIHRTYRFRPATSAHISRWRAEREAREAATLNRVVFALSCVVPMWVLLAAVDGWGWLLCAVASGALAMLARRHARFHRRLELDYLARAAQEEGGFGAPDRRAA